MAKLRTIWAYFKHYLVTFGFFAIMIYSFDHSWGWWALLGITIVMIIIYWKPLWNTMKFGGELYASFFIDGKYRGAKKNEIKVHKKAADKGTKENKQTIL